MAAITRCSGLQTLPAGEMAGKAHRARKAGSKAKKKKDKKKKKEVAAGEDGRDGGGSAPKTLTKEQQRINNPKAFGVKSSLRARQSRARKADREQKRLHAPVLDKTPEEPPPMVVLVHGPPGVGKSTVIKSLVKHYARQNITDTKGPISVISGKNRRITLIECPKDLPGMIDASKIADLVLLVIDGNFGFEMETFEFLNLLQVHGFPKVMGVLTHLDMYKSKDQLKKVKKGLKARFWNEIYEGAKLFYFSGLINGKYPKREVLNLARFISVQKLRPLSWRTQHPYVVADRMEDITPPDILHKDPNCDRDVCLYGYVRGTNLRLQSRVHIAGSGDHDVLEVSQLPDPCPLPEKGHRKTLSDKSRLIYAPMANLGNLTYDKDATYIDIPDWKVQFTGDKVKGGKDGGEGEQMVLSLQQTDKTVDEKLNQSSIQLFAGGRSVLGRDVDSADESDSDSYSEEEDDDDSDSGGDGEDSGSEDEDRPSVERSADGRTRRRAVFQDNGGGGAPGDSKGKGAAFDSESEDEDESDEDDSEGARRSLIPKESGALWKERMGKNIEVIFSTRASDIMTLVYGSAKRQEESEYSDDDGDAGGRSGHGFGGESESEEEDDDDLDFFKPAAARAKVSTSYEQDDCSKGRIVLAEGAWRVDEEGSDAGEDFESIRNRFVTGDWEAGNERGEMRPLEEDEGSDSELYGDFEDLESGEKFGAGSGGGGADGEDDASELAIRKAAKKAAFDEDYDASGSKGMGSGEGEPRGGGEEEKEDPSSYFDLIKRDMNEEYARARAELDAMDPQMRVAMEGYRPGAYVRLRFSGMPCELVRNFDPTSPVVIGGLLNNEHAVGLMRFRLKRHRWHKKILKNKDPLIFSIGWRRFQSIPVYNMQDVGGRYRMIKYTPEHMHCLATVFGPLAPMNTGLVAFQTMGADQATWRISATGTVLDFDHSSKIMKKLKVVGTPLKINRNTAFIEGMFNSNLEVAKFEGAKIRSVSGIRGTIKKAAKVPGKGEGVVRATFEDKLKMSDIVFTRCWAEVKVPRFWNPMTQAFPVMRTVAMLRRERGEGASQNRDSYYLPVERQARHFNPLQVPKVLQQALPYKSKPKLEKKRKRKALEAKRAVVATPEEKKAYLMVQQLNTIRNDKAAKKRKKVEEARAKKAKKDLKENSWREELKKAERKKRYVLQGQAAKKMSRHQRE